MGSLLQDEEIIKLIRGADDNDMISDEELKDLVKHLKSESIGIKQLRHLMYLEMEDLPSSLTVLQKRILLYCFSTCDDVTTCQATSIHGLDQLNQILCQNSSERQALFLNESSFLFSDNASNYVTKSPPSPSHRSPVIQTSYPTEASPIQNFPTDGTIHKYIEEHDTFFMEDRTKVQVVKMRSDGDCLFASVTHQLGTYNPHSEQHQLEIMKAREETVEYLRRNWKTDETIKYNILDSCNQSRLCDYSGTEKQKIEQYLTNLEEGKEWGGIESLKALAEQQKVSIRVFPEDQTTFSVTPVSVKEPLLEIKVAYRKALIVNDVGVQVENYWNHYDSVLQLLPRDENSSDQADESCDGEEEGFTLVKKFFTKDEWASHSHTEKLAFKNVYDRYLSMEQRGFYMKLPYFVLDYQKKLEKEKKKAKKIISPVIPTRRSTRNTTDSTNVERSLPLHNSPVQVTRVPVSPKSIPEKRKTTLTSERTNKRPRLFGKKLVYPTPLPDFGANALLNLNKPAHSRNISPILFECKVFIREHIKSDYMRKSEYEDFSRTMVEKYPLLQTDAGEKSWWTFKKSLSASFRDDRKYSKQESETKKKPKDKKPKSKQQDVLECHIVAETSVPSPDAKESKMKQLSEAKDKKVVAKLLVETKAYRKVRYLKLSSAQKIDEYPHLKNPDLLLLDYLTSKDLNFEDLEENMLTIINLIGNHYEIDVTSQAGKMLAIAEMHNYFLTTAVKKGAKAVFNIVDKRSAMDALLSSPIQSPFLVVHIKNNPFIDEEKELAAAAIGMEGRLLLAMNNSPNAVRCLMIFIAVYNLYDLEYPQAYMEFLRALERFLTGTVVKSKYGNTKKKFDTFHSMIRNENRKKPRRNNNNKKK